MIDFAEIKNIAIIGLSPDPFKPSHQVALYLLNKGYEIFPIYPKRELILGKPAMQEVSELKDLKIDLIVIFRKSEACKNLVQEIVKLNLSHLKGIWLQLGIESPEAKSIALKNGLSFVQNLCIKIEMEKMENHEK